MSFLSGRTGQGHRRTRREAGSYSAVALATRRSEVMQAEQYRLPESRAA
jgi:hypothetical protein